MYEESQDFGDYTANASDDIKKKHTELLSQVKCHVKDPKYGMFKKGFILSFYFLLSCQKKAPLAAYLDSTRLSIQLGGDTDTHACIVGGMIGALNGVKSLPQDMMWKVLQFDVANALQPRPDWLSIKHHCLPNIQKLIKYRPKKALVIDQEFDGSKL